MDPTYDCPMESLPAEIFGEILARLGCTRSVVRCSAVRRGWRQLIRSPVVAAAFTARNEAAVIGFLMEVECVIGKGFYRIDGEPHPDIPSVRALRHRIDLGALGPEPVVACVDGLALKHNVVLPRGFSTMSIFDPLRRLTPVAPAIRTVRSYCRRARRSGHRDMHTHNLMGQFGVLPAAGHSGMAFFVRQPAGDYARSYDGVSFQSSDPIYVHVSVYSGSQWTRTVSGPISSPTHPLFHTMPYCVLKGDCLVCVYAVRFLVLFSIQSRRFRTLNLPQFEAESQGQYAVGESKIGLATLAHIDLSGTVHVWSLNQSDPANFSWDHVHSVNVVDLFRDTYGMCVWRHLLSPDQTPASLHVRAVSRDGHYTIVSIGTDQLVLLLNTLNHTVRLIVEVDPDAVHHIFQVTEPWPPSVFST